MKNIHFYRFIALVLLSLNLMQGKEFGGHSMVTTLKKVLVRKPDQTFGVADPETWRYVQKPDLIKAIQEHSAIVDVLEHENVEVVYHDQDLPYHADAIFVHDPVIVTDFGAIIFQMGKLLRHDEEAAIKKTLVDLDIPILCELSGAANAEGGDMLWITQNILAIGRSFRN